MKAAVVIVMFITILGCVAQQGESNGDNIGEEQEYVLGEAQPFPGTLGLSFTREPMKTLNTSSALEEVEPIDFSAIVDSEGRLIVYYFHSSGCPACKELRPEIDRLEAEYGDVIWKEYDLADGGGEAYMDFAAQHNLSEQQMFVPQVLVNGTIITDRFDINDSLEGILVSFRTS